MGRFVGGFVIKKCLRTANELFPKMKPPTNLPKAPAGTHLQLACALAHARTSRSNATAAATDFWGGGCSTRSRKDDAVPRPMRWICGRGGVWF